MEEFDVLIGRGINGYEVISLNIPVNVFIRDLDRLEERFNDREIYKVNRPRSNTILIVVKDKTAHLLAKDPDIRLAINNGDKINYFSNHTSKNNLTLSNNEAHLKLPEPQPAPIYEPETEPQVIEVEPKKSKQKVKVIVDIPKVIEREIEEPTERKNVTKQIEIIRKNIIHVVKSEIQHAKLICGGTGLGKSFLIEDVLENEFEMRKDIHYIIYKGSMTETGLFTVLIKNPSKIIILDDCDSVWKDDNAINLLKGALDSTVPKVNKKGYIYEVDYIITDDEGEEQEDSHEFFTMAIDNAITDQECISLFNKKVSQIEEAEDLTYKIKNLRKVEAEFVKPRRHISKVSRGKGKDYPIEFRGKLMFVSNLPKTAFDDAVKSRMRISELNLNREETLEYVSKISKHIMPHIKDLAFKEMVIDFYRNNPKLPFNLREFANSLDLALTSPNDWKELVIEN